MNYVLPINTKSLNQQLLEAEARSLMLPASLDTDGEQALWDAIDEVRDFRSRQEAIDKRLVVLEQAFKVTNSRDVEIAIGAEIRLGIDDIEAMEDEIQQILTRWDGYRDSFGGDEMGLDYDCDFKAWRRS